VCHGDLDDLARTTLHTPGVDVGRHQLPDHVGGDTTPVVVDHVADGDPRADVVGSDLVAIHRHDVDQ